MHFFVKKLEDTGWVSGIQGVRKCKTPPGFGVFLSKKWNPHRGLGHSGCWEMQNPTGVWCFFIQKMESPPGSWAFRVLGNAKPHWGLVFFYPKNGIPTGVSDFQGVGKCKTPPGSGIFIVNYSTSWILADNFSQVLFVFPKNFGCFNYFEILGRKNSNCCFWGKRARFNEE